MKNTFIKKALRALGILAALALPSCLQNETTITLNKDGSGTVVEETILGAQMLAMMTQFAEPGGADPLAEMFSDDKAKAKTAKMGEGVEYVKTEMIDQDGKKGARVIYKFADINKIKISPSGAVEDMGDQPGAAEPGDKGEDKETVKFAYADGKLKIITPPTDFSEDLPGEEGAENPEMEAMMTQMMADMRLTLNLKIADGIAQTDATHVEGDTITLFDVQVGKMLAQKDKLKEIGELGKKDKEAAKAAVAKLDGVKVETKEEASVTIK